MQEGARFWKGFLLATHDNAQGEQDTPTFSSFFSKILVRVCFGLSFLTLNECFPRQTVVLSLN